MYRSPTSGKADPSAPVGMTIVRSEKRVRTEVRPHAYREGGAGGGNAIDPQDYSGSIFSFLAPCFAV